MRSFFIVVLPGLSAMAAAIFFGLFLLWLIGKLSRELLHGLNLGERMSKKERDLRVAAEEELERKTKDYDTLARAAKQLFTHVEVTTQGGVPYHIKGTLENQLYGIRRGESTSLTKKESDDS